MRVLLSCRTIHPFTAKTITLTCTVAMPEESLSTISYRMIRRVGKNLSRVT